MGIGIDSRSVVNCAGVVNGRGVADSGGMVVSSMGVADTESVRKKSG